MRNYPLLFEAARSLPIEVVTKASSAWTAERQMSAALPPNVRTITKRLSYVELRDLYAGAQLVVVPLQDTPQAAGLNAIYEALAMRKCVIATRSRGLPDELIHDVTGVIVEPTVEALATAILKYTQSSEQALHIAAAGQEIIRNKASMEIYAESMSRFLGLLATHPRRK
jgi:glycosyltransferase involved in cell wall biosynthesis